MLRLMTLLMTLTALLPSVAGAQEGGVEFAARPDLPWQFYLAPIGSVVALLFAWFFYRWLMTKSEGDPEMAEIAGRVREGAYAYLRQQYKVVAITFACLCLVLCVMAYFGLQGWLVPFAFLTGGFFSGVAGFFGMKTATNAGARTAAGARESLNAGLQVAFRSGAVLGLVVVGLGLFDISAWFTVLWLAAPTMDMHTISVTMLCFGMGASTQALFARVGGGIYTKAADVGADLVGKVEAGIPEDDPRNPATIADNVGDNVGDVAGMGADLYESYCGSILATAALGVSAVSMRGWADNGLGDALSYWQIRFMLAPLVLAGVGIGLSILGIFMVRSGEDASQKQLMAALMRGINGSSLLIILAAIPVFYYLLPKEMGWRVWVAMSAGLIAGIIIGKATEYYTSDEYAPTQEIARNTLTGPATTIIDGISTGMLSVWIPVLTVVLGTMIAYAVCGGFTTVWGPEFGLYGVGMAAVGMLSTLGITLATDAYGPIADNAGGNAEMTHQQPFVRERTDALDSLGNTTAATGKGFAIGSAALTALALLAAYIEEVRIGIERVTAKAGAMVSTVFIEGANEIIAKATSHGFEAVMVLENGREIPVAKASMADFMAFYGVHLMNPKVLCGMLIGSMAAFAFCAFTMKAVGRAAGEMVEEVRRQFREDPGIMEGTSIPDYARCVGISTVGAQREMILPSFLAILVPVVTGIILGVPGVLGLLVAGLSTGFVLAVMMANSGGAWDNAKKYIEKGNYGGKGSDAHKAGVVGDTVGDPFKDTSGPSLNILIKLMSMVSVVFAGLTVWAGPKVAALLGMR